MSDGLAAIRINVFRTGAAGSTFNGNVTVNIRDPGTNLVLSTLAQTNTASSSRDRMALGTYFFSNAAAGRTYIVETLINGTTTSRAFSTVLPTQTNQSARQNFTPREGLFSDTNDVDVFIPNR